MMLALAALSAAMVHAAEPSGPLSATLFPDSTSIDVQSWSAPARHAGDPGVYDGRLRAALPILKASSQTWTFQQSVEAFDFSRALTIPGSDVPVPRALWNVETDAGYRRRLGERRAWGVSVGGGSASDRPYHSIHEITFRATATYRMPSAEENAWLFLLSYSNNRHFANGLPLPGIAYLYHSSEDRLDAVIGLPFLSAAWRPTERWSARASVFGPYNLSAEVACMVHAPFQLYAGIERGQKEWLPAGRTDYSQRLFFDQARASLGLRSLIRRATLFELAAGWDYRRRIYENPRATSKGVPALELAPALSIQARLRLKWS